MLKWGKMKEGDIGHYIEANMDDGWTATVETCIPREETAFCNRRWSVAKGDRVFANGYCFGTAKGTGLCEAVYNVYTTGYPLGSDLLRPHFDTAEEDAEFTMGKLFIKRKDEEPQYLGCIDVGGLSQDRLDPA